MSGEIESSFEDEPKIVVMGGGTGTANLLSALKTYTSEIAAVINTSDDGGSSGELVSKLKVMPPGDLEQAATALSTDREKAEMYNRRYFGHKIGNLIIAHWEQRTGDIQSAMERVCEDLNTTGIVLPVTTKPHRQVLEETPLIYGESVISTHSFYPRRPKTWLEPEVSLNSVAEEKLYEADLIVISAGHPHGSVYPTLSPRGIEEAFKYTRARKVVVANLVNQDGQTDGWHFVDHLKEIERYTGKNSIDLVIHNNDISYETLKILGINPDQVVKTDEERLVEIQATPLGYPIISKQLAPKTEGDILMKKVRNRIRHNPEMLAQVIMQLAD